MDQQSPNLSIECIYGVTVAVFTDEKILEENQLQSLDRSFSTLLNQDEAIKLILDFNRVQFLTSSVLGLLLRISKKISESGGQLRLCNIQPKIFEIFKITRLDKIFDIYTTREEALEGIRNVGGFTL